MTDFRQILVVCLVCLPAFGATVTAHFEVVLPPHFRNYVQAYIGGDKLGTGNWEPKSVALNYHNGRLYGSAQVPKGQRFAFKINLGDWQYSETGLNGELLPNRHATCHQSCNIQIAVANFELKSFHPYPKSTRSNIHYWHDVEAKDFTNYRSVAVYLPPGYNGDRDRYPVIYALDGNNLFDVATASNYAEWGVDESLDYHITKGTLPPVIVVAIYNTSRRADEYLHCNDGHSGGGAKNYAQFIVNTVKPIIDKVYRTRSDRENTSILGASFGGSFALFASHYLGNFASGFAAMSPALWFDNYCMNKLLKTKYAIAPKKIWLDMGDREGWDDGADEFKTGVRDVKIAHQLILQYGHAKDTRLFIHKGAVHHERDWGNRFANVVEYLLK